MQAAHVTTKPTFGILSTERLFSASGYFVSPWAQAYDVTPDGQRFLMLREGESAQDNELIVALHWLDGLKRKTVR